LWDVTRHELHANAKFDQKNLSFNLHLAPHGLSDVSTGIYKIGRDVEEGNRYRWGHPLAQHVICNAAARELAGAHLKIQYTGQIQKATNLENLVGKQGTLACLKLTIEGCEAEDHILFCGLSEDGYVLNEEQMKRMLSYPAKIIKEELLFLIRWQLT
jgi:hypothetical protein